MNSFFVQGNILAAIALTVLAGLATGIGSLAAYVIPRPDMLCLSLSLGFAARVMVYVGFVDLFCSTHLVIGFGYANLFFLPGMLLIYGLDYLIPHIHMDGQVDSQCHRLYRSGIMTTIGIAIHNIPEGLACSIPTLLCHIRQEKVLSHLICLRIDRTIGSSPGSAAAISFSHRRAIGCGFSYGCRDNGLHKL